MIYGFADYVAKNTRVASGRAAMELVKLFRNRSRSLTGMTSRYEAIVSTQETTAVRASKVAGLKLAHVMEGTDPVPKKRARWLSFLNDF